MTHPSDYAALLDDGLPPLPATLSAPTPLASWSGPEFGALVVAEFCEHDEDCEPEPHFVAMTYVFRRKDGRWEPSFGSGGTDWPGGVGTRAEVPRDEVWVEAGLVGSSRGWMCRKADGFAGESVVWVELSSGGSVTRRRLPESGAFVVVAGETVSAVVRFLDADEEIVDECPLAG